MKPLPVSAVRSEKPLPVAPAALSEALARRPARAWPQLRELTLQRFRWILREPGVLFVTFILPILLTLVLGFAFREGGVKELSVAVIEGPGADPLAAAMEEFVGLRPLRCPEAECLKLLRTGRAAAVVRPGTTPELFLDEHQSDGLMAKLMVIEVLERNNGRQQTVPVREQRLSRPGGRYVDFVVPGILGFSLMNSALWTFTVVIVKMRGDKLFKRLAATPMSRRLFLGSFLLTRALLTAVEVAVLLVAARLIFGVTVQGSSLAVWWVGLFGALAFTGISVLLASRTANQDSVVGKINLVVLPMTVLSGVFFPATNFPEIFLPLIKLLPLTALIDAVRAIMNDGASLFAVGPELAVLGVWGLGTYLLALKLFRWT